MIRTENLLYFRWERGVFDEKAPEHNIKETGRCKIGFPRNKRTQYLSACKFTQPERCRGLMGNPITNIPQRSLRQKE